MILARLSPQAREQKTAPTDRKAAVQRAILHGPVQSVILQLSLATIVVLIARTMVGVASAVARAIGSHRHDDADDHVLHGIVLGALRGLLFMVAIWIFGLALFRGLGVRYSALARAITYSRWFLLGAVPIWIVNLRSAALRGAGNVKVPAPVSLLGVFILVLLSPFLIFGFGALPGFGNAGAGLAVTLHFAGLSYPAMAVAFTLSFVSPGAGRPGWTTLPERSGLPLPPVLTGCRGFGATLPMLSVIVASSQFAAAIICLWVALRGHIFGHLSHIVG